MRQSYLEPIPNDPCHGDLWRDTEGEHFYRYDSKKDKWENMRTGSEYTTFALKLIEKQNGLNKRIKRHT